MKKLMLVVAMLAMILAMSTPAFAQDVVAINEGDDVEYNAVCQNILGSVGDITNTQDADADAVAVDDSAAAAEVAQSQDVTIEQANECLNEADLDADGFVTVVEKKEFVSTGGGGLIALPSASASASASTSASASASASASTSASAPAELPETGGASLLALGAGALLVAGGLVARRIVR